MDIRNHIDWDKENGTLSVNMDPTDELRYVILNGYTGNFCLDYSDEAFDKNEAIRRAWSTDTGYYIKILRDNNVIAINWWDGMEESISGTTIEKNPKLFYQAITKDDKRPAGSIIAFAKETFLKLRNCIQQPDNGQASLRTFMYLLAALQQGVRTPFEIDHTYWKLKGFDKNWINQADWEWVYDAFQKGTNNYRVTIKPLVELVLRHASNRLFQEAHREATRKEFQTVMFEGAQRKYDSGISEGAYYTPTPLVRTIVQEALWALDKVKPLSERTNLRILDPACGSAEFLRETLRQLKIRNYPGTMEIIGWDISEIACEMAAFVLNYENRSEWGGKVSITITQRNSLTHNWAGETLFDIVLMNPPFISFENLEAYKTLVQEKLTGLTKRQPDAAALFWKNASEVVNDKGVLGIVLPFSLLDAATYNDLRKYIKEELKINFSLIGRLGSAGLFEKAMIIPSIQVGTKDANSNANTVLWTNYQQKSVYDAFRDLRIYRLSDIPTPIDKPSYSIYENEQLTDVTLKNNWSVNSYSLFQLAEKLTGFDTVGKLFKVVRGADAGNNAAFVLKKEEWLSLPKTERNYFRPCIMRDSIKDGKLNDAWYLFYPYGKYKISSEEELMHKLPIYYTKKLIIHQINLQKRIGKNAMWWELNRHRPWQEEFIPKLVSSYFGKSGYFAFDRDGKYLVCQSFAWLPKKVELAHEQYYFAYLGLLHASLIDTLLEMVCHVLDGGYYDLSKHYIDNMPLPDLTKIDGEVLSYLLKTGRDIYEGLTINKNDLNQVVANIYGLDLNLFKKG